MMPRCDIEKLQNRIVELEDMLSECELKLSARDIECEVFYNENVEYKKELKILAHKIIEVKPELEEWIKLNFGEYL